MDIMIVRKDWGGLSASDECEMYRLRYAMFKERLNWEVVTRGDLEFDEFDRLNPWYVLAKEGPSLCGCWRILPTTGPNMLRDTFPQLTGGAAAPCGEDVWELSRFAARRHGSVSFGLSVLPLRMMLRVVRFGRRQGVAQLVTVTTLGMERLLRHAAVMTRRLGPVVQLGVARAVAISVDTSEATEDALVNALAGRRQIMAA